MQPRAEIFINKNGEWASNKYQRWIMRCSDKFEEETGRRTVGNQDEFTEYLKTQSLEGIK